jgi:hypothetical protein
MNTSFIRIFPAAIIALTLSSVGVSAIAQTPALVLQSPTGQKIEAVGSKVVDAVKSTVGMAAPAPAAVAPAPIAIAPTPVATPVTHTAPAKARHAKKHATKHAPQAKHAVKNSRHSNGHTAAKAVAPVAAAPVAVATPVATESMAAKAGNVVSGAGHATADAMRNAGAAIAQKIPGSTVNEAAKAAAMVK